MIEKQVDCIVRLHDASRLYELNRCIFSLIGQRHRPLQIILALQRFSNMQIADVKRSLEPLFQLSDGPRLIICNWENPMPRDARTELLNMGLAAATGQYVSFLDYDDVLYPEAYEILTTRLNTSGAAIAFASVRVVNADVHPQFIHISSQAPHPFPGENLTDLFRGNFCPIHSYLIDRSVVSPELLSFDTSMTWEEDYDLLLKICAAYRSDFEAFGKVIGDYFYKTDGSNSVPTDGILSEARAREYERVGAFIEVRRRTTVVAPEVQRLLGFNRNLPNLTIRGVLDSLTGVN